jgi:leader peptidase (prepilin peptidase)/N-methyltransferase
MDINNLITNHHQIFLIFTAIIGFIIGSFLNVVIYRLPIIIHNEFAKDCYDYFNKETPIKDRIFNLLAPRSRCPNCETTILWWQNIPLLSYIILRGKCKNCSNPISWRYPIVEILTAIATVLVIIHFGVTAKAFAALILTWGLIAVTFIDFEKQLLPDTITIPLIWLGLLINTMHIFIRPDQAIIGAICGYIFLWLVAKSFKLIRKIDGMGNGDFKLFSAFGAWFGWQMLPVIILAASLLGIIIGFFLILVKKQEFSKPMPFGPYIAITGWLALFWGQPATNWFNTVISQLTNV